MITTGQESVSGQGNAVMYIKTYRMQHEMGAKEKHKIECFCCDSCSIRFDFQIIPVGNAEGKSSLEDVVLFLQEPNTFIRFRWLIIYGVSGFA